MSLVLASASSQYAKYQPGGTIGPTGYPYWFGCMVKPTAVASVQGIIGLYVASDGVNRTLMRVGGSVLTCTEYNAGNLADYSAGAISNGAWLWVIFRLTAINDRAGFRGTNKTTNATSVVAFSNNRNEFIIGAIDNVGIGSYLDGKVAHAVIGTAWDDSYATLLVAGTDPRALPGAGITHYWPLASDYSDLVGSWNLTGFGTPTFDAADQPVLTSNDDWTAAHRTGDRLPYDGPADRSRINRPWRRRR